MNKREIILDFTPLLDVVMILLFAFIMAARGDIRQAQSEAEAAAEASAAAEKAQTELQSENESLLEQIEELQAQLDEYENSPELSAAAVEVLNKFKNGLNMTVNLRIEDSDWYMEVYYGEKLEGTIRDDDPVKMRQNLLGFINRDGYDSDDMVICQMFYDGTQSGSRKAYEKTCDIIRSIQNGNEYRNFYFQTVDISKFGE